MWIREVCNDYLKNLGKCCTYVNFLWKADNVPIYIMDNHLAAAWCWLNECKSDEEYNFMHIDQHSDLKGCGYAKDIVFLRTNPKISFEEYDKITYTTINGNFKFFVWDNYIRCCHFLFPNWFKTNLFYFTKPYLNGSVNEWGYKNFFLQKMEPVFVRQNITQFIEEQCFFSKEFVIEENMQTKKWIVNIDLDFFWDNDTIKVFDDQFINDLGKRICNALNNIQVLTVALSPSCCGGWSNALECSKIFLFNPFMIESCVEYLEDKKLFPNGWQTY